MASVIFDRRRGDYLIQWHDGSKQARVRVHRIARWKKGSERPGRDPVEVGRAKVEYQDRERRARSGQRAADEPVADFLKSYQDIYERVSAPGSVKQLAFAVKHFLNWCETNKIIRLDQVTASVCRQWIVSRSQETSRSTKGPISHASLVKEKALLAAAWSQAHRLDEIDRNPWKTVEIPAKEVKRAKGSWSPEEYTRLMEACRPWLRDIVAIGCHCGLRITAMLGLEWRDIRWAKGGDRGLGEIVVRPELDKVGKGYSVPIHPVSHDVLARRQVMAEGDKVLVGQAGRQSTGYITGRGIIAACRRAGLPEPSSPNHHMRRSFGRWAVLGQLTGNPVPLYIVSRWMGHSTVEMTEKYLDLPRDVSADWMVGDGKAGNHD